MNFSKKDLKRAICYWAKNSYEVWKQLNVANKEIKRLKKIIEDMKNVKSITNN